jgi:4-hydroxy-tetrahydrodipicolinate reductase
VQKIKLALIGASGRMGTLVLESVDRFKIKHVDLHSAEADVVLDFSSPDAVVQWIKESLDGSFDSSALPALVIGSTGWSKAQERWVKKYSRLAPVLMSSNFSIGVYALRLFLQSAGPMMDRLGYVSAITETHHVHKKDSPSGTAVSLQKLLKKTTSKPVKVSSFRKGEVIGDHLVSFRGPSDELTIGHHAFDRSIFAKGALEACVWLVKMRKAKKYKKGLFTMDQFFKDYQLCK